MTAIERLRQLLDERGEKHIDGPTVTAWGRPADPLTGYPLDVYHNQARMIGDYLFLEMQVATPEQAIAATLGAGTCHITVNDNLTETEGMGDVWLECDKCGWQMPLEPSTPKFAFCPGCGRKAVGEIHRG